MGIREVTPGTDARTEPSRFPFKLSRIPYTSGRHSYGPGAGRALKIPQTKSIGRYVGVHGFVFVL